MVYHRKGSQLTAFSVFTLILFLGIFLLFIKIIINFVRIPNPPAMNTTWNTVHGLIPERAGSPVSKVKNSKSMKKLLCIIMLSFGIIAAGQAQDLRKMQEMFLDAEYFLMYEDYADAAYYYKQLLDEFPDNANLAYRLGICYLNMEGRKKDAIGYLEQAVASVSGNYREGSLKQQSAPYDAYYYMGVAYRINYEFKKARETFNVFKNTLMADDMENKMFIDQQIKMCYNAEELIKKPVDFTETNLGEPINDGNDNFNPVLSGDGKTLMYMVSYKFYDAVMFTVRENGRWSPPVNITPDIHSDGDLYISSLSTDGTILFLSKDDDFNSNLYYSEYDGMKWQKAAALGNNINTKEWESHASISADGQKLYFASNREGGYGGLDIYLSERKADGSWGDPENLGPEINTPFNEDRPFILADGITLHFSSQGHNSMGGFDLFYAVQLQNGSWKEPVNMGYPLNSPDDDIFFLPADQGKAGYRSLNKPGGEGKGKKDIYRIEFK